MEDLITHAPILFQSNQSPPLPLAPLGEAPAVVTYGSQSTKVIQVPPPLPPRSPSPQKQHEFVVPPLPPRIIQQQSLQLSTSPDDITPQLLPLPPRPPSVTHSSVRHASNPSDDFAPQLPPRPTNSIHPSLRSGPMSANPARQSLPPNLKPFMEEHIPFASPSTPVPPSVQPATPVSPSATSRSVPPSPSRTLPRRNPTALPLPSPWSDRDGFPSEPNSSAAPTLASAGHSLTSEQSDSPPVTPAPATEEDVDFEPVVSAPSSTSTFESAKSEAPTQSETVQPPSPPLPPKSKSSPSPQSSKTTSVMNLTNTTTDAPTPLNTATPAQVAAGGTAMTTTSPTNSRPSPIGPASPTNQTQPNASSSTASTLTKEPSYHSRKSSAGSTR